MVTHRITLTGRVQAHAFRAFVQKAALRLGIQGQVWYTTSGKVQIEANHPDINIVKSFIAFLHEGPATIEKIEIAQIPNRSYGGFGIQLTREEVA